MRKQTFIIIFSHHPGLEREGLSTIRPWMILKMSMKILVTILWFVPLDSTLKFHFNFIFILILFEHFSFS